MFEIFGENTLLIEETKYKRTHDNHFPRKDGAAEYTDCTSAEG